MRRVALLTCFALTVQLLSRVEATDRWPQFRGSGAGVADDDVAVVGPLVLVALVSGEVLILKEGM